MAFCLTKDQENKLREALVSGKLDPFKLAEMPSSEARRAVFEKFVDTENAANINSLFESKLLLKNQITGFKTWARNLVGVKPRIKRDLLTKIDRLNELGVLNPKEFKTFKEDLIRTRLGINLTFEEAKKVNDLSKVVDSLKEKTDPTKPDIELGRAKIDLQDYVNSLKPVKRNLIINIAGLPRSIMASLDLSAPLNQGWGMVSRKRFYTSLGSMLKSVKSENNFKNLHAWIITHPDYDTAKRAGLRITEIGNNLNKREEQFMSNLVDRVPGIAASQRAYVGFLNKLRMDSFSDALRKAEAKGENVELGSPAAKAIANTVNSFTGGASVGKVEGAVPLINALFFSPRKIKSTLNMMNPLTYLDPRTSKTARIEATRNLIGSLAMSIGIITLHSLLTGEEPETDPTSSDFGRIKSGDTRIDVTGGNATYVNLLSRIIFGRIKSSSGISRELGTGYGETSAFDIIAQFVRYKLSPNASFLVDAVSGENAIGEKKTVSQSFIDRFKPLFLQSVVELLDSDTEGKFGFVLAGLLGAGLNTYSSDVDWTKKTTKEMVDFRDQVGEKKLREANEQYNKEYNEWFEETRKTQTYKDLSDEEKKRLLMSEKARIKNRILKKFGYSKKKSKIKSIDEIRKELETEKSKSVSNLIESAGQILANIDIIPKAHAAEGDRQITNIEIDGDNVITTYKDGGTRYSDIHFDDDFIQDIGHLFHDVGTAIGAKEFGISEFLGFKTREEKIEELVKYKENVLDKSDVLEIKEKEPEAEVEESKKVVSTDYGRNPKFEEIKPSKDVDSAIRRAAKEFDVPAELLFDIALQESSLDPSKVNTKRPDLNPTGLFQFIDSKWKQALKFNNRKGSALYNRLRSTDRTDPESNAMAAAFFIKMGQLGAWDDSEDVWGEFWPVEELEKMGFYKQSLHHKKGVRPSVRLGKK